MFRVVSCLLIHIFFKTLRFLYASTKQPFAVFGVCVCFLCCFVVVVVVVCVLVCVCMCTCVCLCVYDSTDSNISILLPSQKFRI